MKDLKEVFEKVERKFTSANSVEVERATVLKSEWGFVKKYIAQLEWEVSQNTSLQIESLNLNSCRFHDDDWEACVQYSGDIPCATINEEIRT